jgi:hypothetical protein
VFRRLKRLHRAYFSKPAGDRVLYRTAPKMPAVSILEIGVGDGIRTQRLLKHVLTTPEVDSIRYTGIDLFEMREDESGIPLREAHRLLRQDGSRIQLVPGDPFTALARIANTLPDTDLVLISFDQDAESLARSWFYLPRMLHDKSVVLVESIVESKDVEGPIESTYRVMPRAEIDQLAMPPRMRRAA